jgi:FO synthase
MDSEQRAVGRALRRVARAQSLDAAEATALLAARGTDLDELMAAAAAVRDAGLRDAGRPGVLTYSPKVFIPLTRLCRDRCHYCTFATVPGRLEAPYLNPDEVIAIARAGAAAGCTEALVTLGDRPEDRWGVARRWLDERGYDSTIGYTRAMAIAVLEETGLLPHLNPGVMTWEELQRLKPVAPSLGMMLETTSERLHTTPGAVHFASPDKAPSLRLRVLSDAGRASIPFTTGLLVGIGETREERIDSILAIRRVSREFGGIQEVLIQNFRAKPGTAMATAPDLPLAEYLATLAVSRLLLGPRIRLQAPPNLVDGDEVLRLLAAGVDDFGGISPVTPDHVNPERPWPEVAALAERVSGAGFRLARRLTVHPEYVLAGEPWLDPRLADHVLALAGPDGLAAPGAVPQPRPWQEPDGGYAAVMSASGRTGLHELIDSEGRRQAVRGDAAEVYGDWGSVAAAADRVAGAPERIHGDAAGALRRAETAPAGLSDADYLALLTCDGAALEALAGLADDLRRDTVGEAVTYVVNRNLNFTNVCYTGCRFCAFAQRRTDPDAYTLSLDQIAERVAEAVAAGATEICMQGGIHPDMPGTAYFELVRTVKATAPGVHLHAFSPMEIASGAARSGLSVGEWLSAAKEAGLDSIPGTAAEILDDDVRWILTKGKLPAADWIAIVTAAHRLGLRSSATMMYGHVDAPRHWVSHLRTLTAIQDETGGFTEFVPLPFVHQSSPVYLAGVARPGPTMRDNRAVHAVARLLLHGRIDHLQCSWVKLGEAGCRTMLTGGADDLGGTLMEETISRMAGSEHGSSRSPDELAAIAAGIGRPAVQRTTLYGRPAALVPVAGGMSGTG